MTISNSQIRGVGTDSLAISNVEPGTCAVFSDVDAPDSGGLTVQDRTDSCTHYIPSDKVATSSMLNETDLDISSVIALFIGITTGPHNEITVTNLSPSDIDNDYIQADTDKTMTVGGFKCGCHYPGRIKFGHWIRAGCRVLTRCLVLLIITLLPAVAFHCWLTRICSCRAGSISPDAFSCFQPGQPEKSP